MGYPNTYTLVVEDGPNVQTQRSESTGDAVSIVVNNLMENTRYSYYLTATNSLGSDNSTQTNISEQLRTYSIFIFVNFIPKQLQMFKMLPFAKSTTHSTSSDASI